MLLQWDYSAYSLLLFVTAAISALLAGYAWRRRIIPGASPFIMLMVAVAEWSVGYAFEISASQPAAKLTWASLEYIGIVSVPVAWFLFALQYTGHRDRLTRPGLALLALIPVTTLALVFTNARHGLIWRAVSSGGSIPGLQVSYGPAFWLNWAYAYLLILAGTLLLTRFFLRAQGLFRMQARVVLLAAFVPWIGNAIYVSRFNPFPNLDLTPFAFAITGLLTGWGFLRLQFLDIIPLARGAIMESMRDAVFVLDAMNRIADMNPAAQAILKRKLPEIIGLRGDQVFFDYPDLVKKFSGMIEAHEILIGGSPSAPQYFDLEISPLYDRLHNFTGRLVILQDITEQEQARLTLEQSHAELEVRVRERTSDLEAANEKLQVEIAERRAVDSALHERVEMEGLVTEISTGFINRTIEEIDHEIDLALETIGKFAGVDRSYVFRLSSDGATLDNSHEWCAPGVPAQKDNLQGIPCALLPWWMGRLERREIIHIPRFATLPREARTEKELLRSKEIQSLIVVPLVYGNVLTGFLGFDSLQQEKVWAEADILLLRLVGEIFANALARKETEEALQTSAAELRGVFAAMNDHVIVLDQEGRYLKVAPTHQDSLYQPAEELLGKSVHEVLPEATAQALLEQIQRALILQETVYLDYSVEINAQPVWFSGAISPLPKNRVVMVARDITERKASEEQLVYKVLHDPLTGLPNRRLFIERLERVFERVKRHTDALAAVLFMDLDRFKVINDSLGHTSGDKFLTVIARRLRVCMRTSDTVARMGGDEFAILLEDINDIREAMQVAERIQNELSAPFDLEGHQVFSSASIGIALVTSSYHQPEEVLRDADAAMYRAKARGKGRHEAFNTEMHLQNLDLLELQADLRRAVEQEEFQVFYQPIVDMKTGAIQSVEALLRWQHPSRGMLFPDSFLPLAEETRFIAPIGEWVLRAACGQVKAWHQAGYGGLRVAVNISAHQFRELQLLDLISSVLVETNLEPQFLEIEVSEQTAMQDIDLTTKILAELSRLGVQISIDDFGKGYSSLSYLKTFPTNTLKIDRSFIQDVVDNQNGSLIASAIIAMAHKLRLSVIAEGVETRQQLSFLASQKCDQIQGFLISQAVPAPSLAEMLDACQGPLSGWQCIDRQIPFPGMVER